MMRRATPLAMAAAAVVALAVPVQARAADASTFTDRLAGAAANAAASAAADALGAAGAGVPGPRGEAEAHVLVPADVVQFRVLNYPELDTAARIDAGGAISFPYIGTVALKGLTPDQAADLIARRLEEAGIFRDAEVMATLVGFGSGVSMLGAVGAPGLFPLDRPMTVTQLLARAGGLAPTSEGKAILRRQGLDGSMEIRNLDLKALLRGEAPHENVVLHNNDEIYVPEAPVFYLYGNVNAPGAYPMSRPLTVQQALAVGGGLTQIGSESRIRIKRRLPDGRVVELSAELDDTIQPNDTIEVPERIF